MLMVLVVSRPSTFPALLGVESLALRLRVRSMTAILLALYAFGIGKAK